MDERTNNPEQFPESESGIQYHPLNQDASEQSGNKNGFDVSPQSADSDNGNISLQPVEADNTDAQVQQINPEEAEQTDASVQHNVVTSDQETDPGVFGHPENTDGYNTQPISGVYGDKQEEQPLTSGGWSGYNTQWNTAQTGQPAADPASGFVNPPPVNPQTVNPVQSAAFQQTAPIPGAVPVNPSGAVPPAQTPQAPGSEYKWDFSDYSQYNVKAEKPKKSMGLIAAVVVLAALLVILSGVFVFYIVGESDGLSGIWGENTSEGAGDDENDKKDAPNLNVEDKPAGQQTANADGELTTPQIANAVRPSVVGIVVYIQNMSYQPAGQGTGVIMTEDGYIISNAHVFMVSEDKLVDGIKVVLSDESEFEAELVGIDVKTDLAVIKIKATGLKPATFGDSDKIEVGETVVAIGNPGGLEYAGSVSQGVVSGVNRTASSGSYATTFIQTDAAINPGNSGGPLVNRFGQVIGINSSKIVYEGYEGIGFAIPMTEAQPIINDLLKNGYVKNRVRIGITYTLVDDMTAGMYNIPVGLRVESVDETLDIAKKGVKKGDIITKLDGRSAASSDAITEVLKTKKPGDTIRITVYRQSTTGSPQTLNFDVILAEDTQTIE